MSERFGMFDDFAKSFRQADLFGFSASSALFGSSHRRRQGSWPKHHLDRR
jgi:hypothetical protein